MVNPAEISENGLKVIKLLQEHGTLTKSDAPQYGMPSTTFQNHAKILVKMGILREIKQPQQGKGAPKVAYELVKNG